jgi:hypothetical protein
VRRSGRPPDRAPGQIATLILPSDASWNEGSFQDASEGRISVAICPGAVRAACTATAASRPTSAAAVLVRTQAETGRAQPSVSAVSCAS